VPAITRSILVVDDDASYRSALEAGLTSIGYSVSLASDAHQALRLFETRCPDLVLLDIRLPGMSGTDLCRELRRQSDVPIIMISDVAEELDIVLCFELGADDFVPKPFRLRELNARLESTLRHWERGRKAAGLPTRNVERVEIGPYRIDFVARTVEVNGQRVELVLKEFDLLAHFAAAPGRVCSRREIMVGVWGHGEYDDVVGDKTLDVHMYRLRNKLEKDPAHPKWIVRVRGVGYLLHDGKRAIPAAQEPTTSDA
jgi:two-component system response regulator RegX3